MPLHRWIVTVVSHLVPRSLRGEWREEWDAELDHREKVLAAWNGSDRRPRLDLVRRSAGAFWDALWLQSSRWYALRLFGRHWRLALAAVLSLSATFATTAIGYAAYSALLVRPPAVGNPQSLKFIHVRTESNAFGPASFAEFAAYRERTRAFSDVAAFPYQISTAELRLRDRSAQVLATQVSSNFFPVLQVQAVLGTLVLGNSLAGDADRIVIGQALWRRLGSPPDILGAQARINDHPVTIAGVVPAGFSGMTLIWNPDMWMSLKAAETVFGSDPHLLTDSRQRWLHLAGRLHASTTRVQAMTDAAVLVSGAAPRPDELGTSAIVTNVTVTPPGDRAWMRLLLGGLVSIVLLALIVACSNVTNLLLGLAATRRHEMLVRAALGASRLQLAAPLVRESLVLGFVSATLGLGAAAVTLNKLADFRLPLGNTFPSPSIDFRLDASVIFCTILTAIVAGLAVGLPPALRASADGLAGAITRESSAGAPGKGRIRGILVVIQMTVATLVMIGVGVSIRSLIRLEHIPLGFSARHLSFATINLAPTGGGEQAGRQIYERALDRVARLPGVVAVTLADSAPLSGFARESVAADGSNAAWREMGYAVVHESYFSTIGMAVRHGRTFDSRDRTGSPEVVIINETMASVQWPGQDPIGRTLRIKNGNRLAHVVGIVPDSKYEDVVEEPQPFMYFALGQHYQPAFTVIARGEDSHVPSQEALMGALADLDTRAALTGWLTLEDLLLLYLLLPRTVVIITVTLGVLTLALAVLGLYSSVFYSVSQRRLEIGIRVALGAEPFDILKTVLRQTGWVAALGAGLGVIAGSALLPIMSSVFYGIGPVEPVVVGSVALTSAAIAVATTYHVARPWTRSSSIDLLRR